VEHPLRKLAVRRLVLVIAISSFLVLSLPESSFAQNYERIYLLQRGESTFQLTISITHTLYDYYLQKSHQAPISDLDTFVTPYSLALVAADIRTIFPGEEEFVNGVLMVVHQIPYEVVAETKYPVETMIDNKGDCDLLSYIAASMLETQGLDIVLFYYEQESHMNLGINLQNPPQDSRTTVTYVDYQGTRYYMAECTGNDWETGWRIGEMPPELEGAQITVIPLENVEETAPGQVSSSFGSLQSSTISLTASSFILMEGNPVTITGRVTVPDSNITVSLYAATNNNWHLIGTTQIDSNGRYAFSWNPASWGQYHLKASWPGDDEYAGADSSAVSIYVLPKFLVFAFGGALILTVIAVVIFLIYRTTHPKETQTFEASQDVYS